MVLRNVTRSATFIAKNDDKRLVTGIVYAPNETDSQGDYAEADEIEKAAHEFLADWRVVKTMHKDDVSRGVQIVESFIAPVDYTLDNGEKVRKGAWVVTLHVDDDGIWDAVKSGEYAGLSMGGRAVREKVPA